MKYVQCGEPSVVLKVSGVVGRWCDRVDHLADDPCVFADLPATREAEALEKLNGRAEQEPANRLTASGDFGDSLDETTAGLGDLVKSSAQRRAGDALTAMLSVDPEAGNPPVRTRRHIFGVLAPVLDVGQFLRAAVLTPSLRGAILVEHKRRVRPPG